MSQESGHLHKRFEEPDERREFEKGHSDVVHLGDTTVARFTFEPGWRWSEHVKPVVGTESCQVAHTGIVVKGRLGTRLDDGTEFEAGPGEAVSIPPGHDGWVVGDEVVEFLEVQSASAEEYARED